jgi:hypothetical protein
MHPKSTTTAQTLEIQIESLNAVCIKRNACCTNNSEVKLQCSYDMKYLGIWVLHHILVIYVWLFILYLLVYIVEGYILCLIINYMSIANYTVHSPNMTGYHRTIPLWLKSVNFCDIFWIPLVSNTPSCTRCLSLFHFRLTFDVTVTVS